MSLTQFERSASITTGEKGGAGFVLSGLKIVFNVTKTKSKNPNTAKIEIYNLSENTRNKIKASQTEKENGKSIEKKRFVIINAGYLDGDGEILIFTGNIDSVSHMLKKPEVITTIQASDGGFDLFNTSISLSYGVDSNAETILKKILNSVPLSNNYKTASITHKVYTNGFSFIGLAKDALTKVTKFMGLDWTVQNEEIRLVVFDKDDLTRAVKLTPETGLIGSPEKLAGKSDQAKGLSTSNKPGWKVTSLLQPKINPNGKVALQCRDIPKETLFTVSSVTHSGDTYGDAWGSVIEVKE